MRTLETQIALADQLADVRAEIRALRQVEASVREALLAQPGRSVGQRFVAFPEAKRIRRFDAKLLPKLTYQDPKFWSTRTVQVVRVHAVGTDTRSEDRARSDAATGCASEAGIPRPAQGPVRHDVPDDLGPEHYVMSDDFWDRV